MKRFDLSGRKALITGASRGLGRAMAEALLEAGSDAAILARSDLVFTTARELAEKTGRQVIPIQADLGERSQLSRAFEDCMTALGTLDILIVNHGIQRRSRAESLPFLCCVSIRFAPPPSFARSRNSFRCSNFS